MRTLLCQACEPYLNHLLSYQDGSSYSANVAFAISNSLMMTSLCLSDRGVNHAGNFLGEKTKPSEYPVETLASTLAEESGLDVILKPQEIFAMFKSFIDNMSARIRVDNLAVVVTIS